MPYENFLLDHYPTCTVNKHLVISAHTYLPCRAHPSLAIPPLHDQALS